MNNLTLSDFTLTNEAEWSRGSPHDNITGNGQFFEITPLERAWARVWGIKDLQPQPMYVTDPTTQKEYWNQPKWCIRLKCVLLSVGTPVLHVAASVYNIAYRIVKLASFLLFWVSKGGENESFDTRLREAKLDLLRIFTSPIAILALELVAIYGIYDPMNGRKLYASIERAQYEDPILAPCFQPSPAYHLLGGKPYNPYAF